MPGMSAALPHAVPPPAPEPRYHPLVVVLIAAVAGILLDRFWPLPLWAWWTLATAGLGLWIAFAWRQRSMLAGFALLLAVAATAGAWHHCRWYLTADDELGRFTRRKAQPACVEAVVVQMPRPLRTPASDPLRMMPATEGCRIEVDLLAVRDGSRLARRFRPGNHLRARPRAGTSRRRSAAMFRPPLGAAKPAKPRRVRLRRPTARQWRLQPASGGSPAVPFGRPTRPLAQHRRTARPSPRLVAIGSWKRIWTLAAPRWRKPFCWANAKKSIPAARRTSWPPAPSTFW